MRQTDARVLAFSPDEAMLSSSLGKIQLEGNHRDGFFD
jgi:hypothetical protein